MLHFISCNDNDKDNSINIEQIFHDSEKASNTNQKFYLYHYMPFSALLLCNKDRDKLYLRCIEKWNDPYETRLFNTDIKDKTTGSTFTYPLRKQVYGACFTTGYNAEGQWKVYESPQDGPRVLITLEISEFFNALRNDKDHDFYVGFVSYHKQQQINSQINQLIQQNPEVYKRTHDLTPEDYKNLLKPLFIKRQAFSYEREVRIIMVDKSSSSDAIKISLGSGNSFTSLIKSITLSPYASESWIASQKALLKYAFPAKKIRCNYLLKKIEKPKPIIIN